MLRNDLQNHLFLYNILNYPKLWLVRSLSENIPKQKYFENTEEKWKKNPSLSESVHEEKWKKHIPRAI